MRVFSQSKPVRARFCTNFVAREKNARKIGLYSALRITGPCYRGVWMCIAGVWDLQTTSFEIP